MDVTIIFILVVGGVFILYTVGVVVYLIRRIWRRITRLDDTTE